MAEPSEIFLPASAAFPAIEARIEAGWTLLSVTGMRVRKGDATPESGLHVDFSPDGTTDIAVVRDRLEGWPTTPDLFAEVRFGS